jgi:hypothetical protein
MLRILLLLPAMSAVAKADVLFGNYSLAASPAEMEVSNSSITGGSSGFGKAICFTVGDNALDIQSITLHLVVNTSNSTAVPTVTIWTISSSGTLESRYATFVTPAITTPSGSWQNIVFTASGSVSLSAATSYALVVTNSDSASTTIYWGAAATNNTTLLPTGVGATYLNMREGTGAPTGWNSAAVKYNGVQIDGTIVSQVPEPASIALLLGAAGLAAVACLRYK